MCLNGKKTMLARVWSELRGGQVQRGMDELFQGLRSLRRELPGEQWKAFVEEARAHSLCRLLREDPLTNHAYERPRGYPGDAALLDLIYDGFDSSFLFPKDTTELGRGLFRYMAAAPAAQAVRSRRRILAGLVDECAADTPGARVLSVAAGHLREAELSHAVTTGRLAEYVALDQDAESLAAIEARHRADGVVRTVEASARDLVANKHQLGEFDLIYSAGLFDYLSQRFAKVLLNSLFQMLRPGGRLVVFNFLPDIRDVGYMGDFPALGPDLSRRKRDVRPLGVAALEREGRRRSVSRPRRPPGLSTHYAAAGRSVGLPPRLVRCESLQRRGRAHGQESPRRIGVGNSPISGETLSGMGEPTHDVTGLLRRIGTGDGAAEGELFQVLYAELHGRAQRQMEGQRPDHTLQATALVNEVWMRVARSGKADWQDRNHFLATASRAMRQILVDHARARRRKKRSSEGERVPLDSLVESFEARSGDLASLDSALANLARRDPVLAKAVDLRFFGGLTMGEAARALGLAERTLARRWAVVRAWLKAELGGEEPGSARSGMNPERWHEVEDLYLRAFELEEQERPAFLESIEDPELRREVERLLGANAEDASFLEPPHSEFDAQILPSSSTSLPQGLEGLDLTGEQLGEFMLLRELGRGGMGVVYLARQSGLERLAAVKLLLPIYRARPDLLERFRREALSLSRLRHPAIASILSFGEERGLAYYAMEYVDGPSLRELLDTRAGRAGR